MILVSLKSKSARIGAIGFVALALAGSGAAYFMLSDTSLIATGPTSISDYREFPTRQISTSIVTEGLDAPWAFDWLPNGDILVTERFGSLRLVRDGILLPAPVSGVPEVFAAGQGGLLDIAVHPDFDDNQYVYLSYAHGTEEGNRLRVVRATLTGTELGTPEVVFEVAQTKTGSSHYGSRFLWLPDGTLVFSVGDGGNPPIQYSGELIREQAQFLSSHLGKLIRINDDGSIPADNPFVGRPDVRHEIYSFGHRNVQGIAYDAVHDRLIVSEHGSKGGDELNLILPGANYGWPLTTYSTEYDLTGSEIAQVQSLEGMEDPLAVWTPTIAPSEVVAYSANQYPNWSGDLFLAAMLLRADNSFAAYASSPAGAVLRLGMNEAGEVTEQERLLVGEVRVRSIEQGPDGYLYVLTDGTAPQNRPGTEAGLLLRIDG